MPTITTKIVDSAAAGGGTGSVANPYTFAEMVTNINAGSAGAAANFEYVLNDGTYTRSSIATLTNGGSSNGPCIIRSKNPLGAKLLGAVGLDTTRFDFFQLTTGSNANYLTWDGIVFDGNYANNGTASIAVHTFTGANLHHLTLKNNVFTGLQGTSNEFASADYVTIVGNVMYQNGKLRQAGLQSGCSGISLNVKNAAFAFDSYTGFHNIIAYNVIAGQYGPPSDGNGIILDNGGGATALTLQNTLIIRNIVYGNGGRGIHGFRTIAPQGHWIVNNVCFKNGLDQTETFNNTGFGDEFDAQSGGPWYFVNNVAVPWTGTGSAGTTAFRDANTTGTNYNLSNNTRVTGGRSANPMTATAGQIDDITDPGFVVPPTYNPNTIGDAFLVPDPRTIGSAFDLKSTSVLKNTGVDPRTLFSMNANMQSDIAPYLTIGFGGRQAPF
jgi:hypothetical protein